MNQLSWPMISDQGEDFFHEFYQPSLLLWTSPYCSTTVELARLTCPCWAYMPRAPSPCTFHKWSSQCPVPVAVSAVVQPGHRPGIDSESPVPLELLTSIKLYYALIVLIVTNILWYCFNAPGIHMADPIHLTKSHKSVISCLQKSEKSIPLGNSHVTIICDLHHGPVVVRSDLFLSSTGSRVLGDSATRWLPAMKAPRLSGARECVHASPWRACDTGVSVRNSRSSIVSKRKTSWVDAHLNVAKVLNNRVSNHPRKFTPPSRDLLT